MTRLSSGVSASDTNSGVLVPSAEDHGIQSVGSRINLLRRSAVGAESMSAEDVRGGQASTARTPCWGLVFACPEGPVEMLKEYVLARCRTAYHDNC